MGGRSFIRKACLLGDGAVGKTSMIGRYVHDVFSDDYLMSVGTKVTKKVMEFDDVQLTMMLWDVLGQKGNESLHSAYYKGANGAMLVCDITRSETIDHLVDWRESLFTVTGKVPVVIAVNKSDLKCDDNLLGCLKDEFENVLYTSARTGEGVEEAFDVLVTKMMRDVL